MNAEGVTHHRLSARGLVKRYKGRTVVEHVDLELTSREVVGLLGPNGAGKTTTFYMMVGLVPADEGVVELDGEIITTMPLHQRARMGIGYLPQEASVFRELSVADNIEAILELRGRDRQARRARVDLLLEELSLGHVRESLGRSLSGGERRRVELARVLALDPKFVLLDEPFAGVDPIAVGEIQSIVTHLTGRGIGVLITDHNVRETLKLVDRAAILHAGRILVTGTPDEIVDNPQARAVYLGEGFAL